MQMRNLGWALEKPLFPNRFLLENKDFSAMQQSNHISKWLITGIVTVSVKWLKIITSKEHHIF